MARLLHFAAAVALGGLATAGLTACTGDAEVSPSPTPVVTEASETPSPTPTLTAEEELLAQIPEDARAEGFVEATNFAKFFLTEWNDMYSTQETALFESLALEGCTFCESSLDEIEGMRASGGSATRGEMTFPDTPVRGGVEASGSTNVTFDVNIGATQILDADGVVVNSYNAEQVTVAVLLEWDGAKWQVVDVGAEPR